MTASGEGTALHDMPFLVVDVETTGVSAWAGDRLTEVAAVLVQRGKIREVFESLVNPRKPISAFITSLTGISNEMVRNAPVFKDIAGPLAAEMAGRVFVAHNAGFDWKFLSTEFQRVTPAPLENITSQRLCTVRLARRFLSHLPRRNLDAVAHHYGISISGRHRAMGDARATAHVLVGLLKDAERHGIYTWEALDELMSRRTARAKRRRRSALPSWSDGRDGA